jgi:hypothetical protein
MALSSPAHLPAELAGVAHDATVPPPTCARPHTRPYTEAPKQGTTTAHTTMARIPGAHTCTPTQGPLAGYLPLCRALQLLRVASTPP